MSTREAIIAAIERGERYKNIAVDNNCSQPWVSKIARLAGYRRNKQRKAGPPLVQTTIALSVEVMTELKLRGRMAIQIRQAVEEYLERHRVQPHRRSHAPLHGGPNPPRP